MKMIGKRFISLLLSLTIMFSMIFSGGYIDKVYAADTQRIDVTALGTGEETSHDCKNYIITKHDDTYHWKECAVCGKVYNTKEKHTIIDNGWSYGSADICNKYNVHRFSCSCGYSYTNTIGRANHSYPSVYDCTCQGNHLHRHCLVCREVELKYPQYGENRCHPAGKKTSCNSTFTCVDCGALIYKNNDDATFRHNRIGINGWGNMPESDNDGVYCLDCGLVLMKSQHSNYYINSKGQGVFTTVYELPDNAQYDYNNPGLKTVLYGQSSHYMKVDDTTVNINGNKVTVTSYLTYTAHEESLETVYHDFFYVVNGERVRACSYCWYDNGDNKGYSNRISPDLTAPSIDNITQTSLSSYNGWSTKKKLTFSGTENYCETVNLTLKDSDGNVVGSATTSVKNHKWSCSIIPNIEADANGKNYTLYVTDSLLNQSTKKFIVSKTDAVAPIVTTSTDKTSTEWSRTKDFTATATDKGVGDVSIAFNKKSGYVKAEKNGTSYSQKYSFVGDVYGSTHANILYKDALGNETNKFVTISNLDNTAPTITKTDISSSVGSASVTVTANDKKDFGGSVGVKDGSGVTGYAISTSNKTPSNFQTSNVLTVSKSGDYYVFV